MVFQLPPRPQKENRINRLMEGLNVGLQNVNEGIQSYRERKQLKEIENLLRNAQNPEEAKEAYVRTLMSKSIPEQSKERLLAPLLQRMYEQPQNQTMQQGFEPEQRMQQGYEPNEQGVPREQAPRSEIPPEVMGAFSKTAKQKSSKDELEYKQMLAESTDYNRNKAWIDPIYAASEKAAVTKNTLDYLRQLAESGELNSIPVATIAQKYPVLSGLLSPETQTFNATVQELVSGITNEFKGRILQSEIEIALKRIPSTLRNTPEGMRMIIDRLESVLELPKARAEALTRLKEEARQKKKPLDWVRGQLEKETDSIAKSWQSKVKQFEQQDELVEITDPETGKILRAPRWLVEQ